MDIKIQPGKTVSKIDSPTDTAPNGIQEVVETAAADPNDAVTSIAMELVEGKIDTSQAVDRLIEQTMNIEIVASAPAALRTEVEQMLRSTIETDAHLISLTQKLE